MFSSYKTSKLPTKKIVDEKLDLIPENETRIPDVIPQKASAKYADNIAAKNGIKKPSSSSKIQPKTEAKSPRTVASPSHDKEKKSIIKSESGKFNDRSLNDGDPKSFRSVKDMINSKINSQNNSNPSDIKSIKFNENGRSKDSSFNNGGSKIVSSAKDMINTKDSSINNGGSKVVSSVKDMINSKNNNQSNNNPSSSNSTKSNDSITKVKSFEKEDSSTPVSSLSLNTSSSSSSSSSTFQILGTMTDSIKSSSKPMNTDNKSRDNALYLAKSFSKSINIISPRSNLKVETNIPARSFLNRIPTPRSLPKSPPTDQIESQSNPMRTNGKYQSRNISIDSRDGKGYGRKINIQPKLNKELFLSNKDGIIVSLQKKNLELLSISSENVVSLINKFTDLTPEDYDHMAIHRFGFEKIYSISDTVLQEYNPFPSVNNPYKNKNTNKALDHKDYKYDHTQHEKIESNVSIIIDQKNNHGEWSNLFD